MTNKLEGGLVDCARQSLSPSQQAMHTAAARMALCDDRSARQGSSRSGSAITPDVTEQRFCRARRKVGPVAIRKQTIERQANALVARVLQPGDRIISGVYSMTGPNPMYGWMLAAIIAAALSGAVGATGVTYYVILIGVFIVASVPSAFTDHYYVAVTRRQVVFVKMNGFTNRPKQISSTAPLHGVGGISDYRPNTLGWSSFRYTVPTAPPLRLNVPGGFLIPSGSWRRELDALVGAFGVPVR
ncbi:hypothetical protein AB0L00_01320 [Actinoallomurus sp. NPDC052308]|uniref:hypothetical protein n=1 Tax=Actinoallomurus sp. NPDC052308 TaxID=3155530 RepID=UPI00342BC335